MRIEKTLCSRCDSNQIDCNCTDYPFPISSIQLAKTHILILYSWHGLAQELVECQQNDARRGQQLDQCGRCSAQYSGSSALDTNARSELELEEERPTFISLYLPSSSLFTSNPYTVQTRIQDKIHTSFIQTSCISIIYRWTSLFWKNELKEELDFISNTKHLLNIIIIACIKYIRIVYQKVRVCIQYIYIYSL